jgi:small subunit ribosomal protein S6
MEKNKHNLYEGLYILSPTLSDDARLKAVDRITGEITKNKGEIKKILDWGRKKLAYEINGKKEGHYFLVYFDAPTQVMPEVWHENHLNEDLIRFVTLRAEEVKEVIEFKPLIQE